MAKFFSYRKSRYLTNVKLLVGSYMAFSLETMQKSKHSSFFENMLVHFEGILLVAEQLKSGIKDSDCDVHIFINQILEVCLGNIAARYGMSNTAITTKIRDRVIDIYRYLLCDFLPALQFTGPELKLAVSRRCFDVCVKILEATRLGLDKHPHEPCKYISDLLSTTFQSISKGGLFELFDPVTRGNFHRRCLIYLKLVLNSDFRSSELAIFYATEIYRHCVSLPFKVDTFITNLRNWFWVGLVFAVYPVNDYGWILH